MRLAGELARRTLHIPLKHRGEVGWIAETATLGYFRDIESRIQKGALGKFHAPHPKIKQRPLAFFKWRTTFMTPSSQLRQALAR